MNLKANVIRSVFILILIFIINNLLSAQEQLGIRASHYGGVHSLTLNPASGFNYHHRSDLNIIGFGVSAFNNYAYIEDFSALKLLSHSGGFISRPEANSQNGISNSAYVDFFSGQNNYWYYGHAEVMLPSMLYILNEKWSFGLINRIRAYSSSFDIPQNAGYYEYSPIAVDNPFLLDPTSLFAVGWAEIGANAAYSWSTSRGYINVGISLKYLAGLEGFFIKSNDDLNITKRSSVNNLIKIQELNVELGYASSLVEEGSISQRGQGFAADLGFELTVDSNDPKKKFNYRIGASILDIGHINFNDGVNYHQFFKTSSSQFELDTFRSFSDVTLVDDAVRLLEDEIFGTTGASRVNREIDVYTPAAVSLYFDKALGNNWYINSLLIQRLNYHDNILKRASQLAVLPRYEGEKFGFSLPVSLLEWQKFRVGLSGRIGIFYFGTEDLSSLVFGKRQFDGADVYLALKFSPFKWNKKGPKAKISEKKKGGVKCP